MRKVKLGSTGLEVSQLCLGTGLLGRQQLHLAEETAVGILRKAVGLGVNFIDTAQCHQTYGLIHQALRGVEEDIVVMSRSFARDYEEMEKALYEAKRELRRDVVDIFLMQGLKDEADLSGRAWALRAIGDFKEAGAVRAVGVSTWTVPGLRAAASCAEVEVVAVPFNERGLGLHEGTGDEAAAALKELHERGVGIIATTVLGGGFLAAHAAQAIGFARGLPFIDVVRISPRSVDELQAAAHLLNDEAVPPELLQAVEHAPRQLHVLPWCTACGACVDACPEHALAITGHWRHKLAQVYQSQCTLCGACGPVCPVSCLRVF
jgi:predicted aldo/keto reductase-like oxidoreductase